MLIAVSKYKDKLNAQYYIYGEGKITVFDTDDGTTEAVLCKDLAEAMAHGVAVENITVFNGKFILTDYCYGFSGMLPDDSYVYLTQQKAGSSRVLFVGNTALRFKEDWNESCLKVNDIRLIDEFDFNIHYVFKAMSNVIVRMSNRKRVNGHYEYCWFTVAVDGSGALKYWNEDYSVANDKVFALKVDLSSEV